jgi:membrane protein DedA with SNARE-associated domain
VDETPEPSAVAAFLKRNLNWLVLAFGFTFFVFPHISPWESLNYYLAFTQRFSEWTLRKLENLFSDYGYYVVFLGVFLENSMFLGLLVPGSIILVLGGLAGENGTINVWLVMALAIAATISGDTISYLVGRMGWTKALERSAAAGTIERLRGSMQSNATWIILAYHWTGYSRALGPAAAGTFRIPYRKWAPLDYAGGTVWAIAYTMLGVLLGVFGVEFGDTKVMLRLIELMFLIIIVVAIGTAWYRASKGALPPTTPSAPITVPVEDD